MGRNLTGCRLREREGREGGGRGGRAGHSVAGHDVSWSTTPACLHAVPMRPPPARRPARSPAPAARLPADINCHAFGNCACRPPPAAARPPPPSSPSSPSERWAKRFSRGCEAQGGSKPGTGGWEAESRCSGAPSACARGVSRPAGARAAFLAWRPRPAPPRTALLRGACGAAPGGAATATSRLSSVQARPALLLL